MDTQIINVSLPIKLLRLADHVAAQEARSRSELFREAIRSYVLRRQRWDELFSYAQRKTRKMKLKSTDVTRMVKEYRSGK